MYEVKKFCVHVKTWLSGSGIKNVAFSYRLISYCTTDKSRVALSLLLVTTWNKALAGFGIRLVATS